MELLNTVLILVGLVAFVMYLKNFFDVKEGAVTNVNHGQINRNRGMKRQLRRLRKKPHGCRYGYKKAPKHVAYMGKNKPWKGVDYKGRKNSRFRGGHMYDFECKAPSQRRLGNRKNERQKREQAEAAKRLIKAGVGEFSFKR